ncbi:MAG: hypothetical protein OSA98_19340 [Rubripirellula sp.]|nr:hypothetical protein [Rubripirellula sp.]
MMNRSLRSFGAFCLLVGSLASSPASFAHSPVDFLEVIRVKPAQTIVHGVETKSRYDSERKESSLEGPDYFSRGIGAMKRAVKIPRAYMNWFAIKDATPQPKREVDVLDMVRGASSKRLQIGNAEFLISPSQLLTSGVPDAVPEGLDIYTAYQIHDGGSVELKLDIESSLGKGKATVGKPIYLCMPTEEWHHDETFPVTHPNDCFVVYEIDEQPTTSTFSTIDQFGINELQASSVKWICVRAAFLRDKSK